MKRLVALVLVLAGCSSDAGPNAYAWESNGVSISYPTEWELAPESLTPALGFPMLVAISTFAAPAGGATCAHVAADALDAIGPEDVLLTIHELPLGYAFGPRPDSFEASADFSEVNILECMQTDSTRIEGGYFRFFESGRTFEIMLAMGPDTPDATAEKAWAVLDSFSADRIGP